MSYVYAPKTCLISLDRRVKMTRGVKYHTGTGENELFYSVSYTTGGSWQFTYRGFSRVRAQASFDRVSGTALWQFKKVALAS